VLRPVFFWGELGSSDFRALDPEKTILIVPVAATERHGPHLPVMADTAIGKVMLARLKSRLPAVLSILVLPIQASAKSNEHLLPAGPLSFFTETLSRVLREIAEEVHRAGLSTDSGERAWGQCRRRDQCGARTVSDLQFRLPHDLFDPVEMVHRITAAISRLC
jgi:Creatinine amidohydrolase